MNRLTKDVDTIDNTLPDAYRMLVSTGAGIVGSVVLISIVQPYFLIAVSDDQFLFFQKHSRSTVLIKMYIDDYRRWRL